MHIKNTDKQTNRPRARAIAFYLPQFHPIPENDRWWGIGFTEWTNVSKARPLFKGHYQPRIPADLGFYDLRVPETRAAQAKMASDHGIEGFCYWHYWFAGKRLLERPFKQVLKSGEPNFPFCLAWANQTWTGIWHGAPDRILIEQNYPGLKDHKSHFNALVQAFHDSRYIKIEGKPIFIVYYPPGLPQPKLFTDYWNELAVKSGLPGFYFLGVVDKKWDYKKLGFDGSILDSLPIFLKKMEFKKKSFSQKFLKSIMKKNKSKSIEKTLLRAKPKIYFYKDFVKQSKPPINDKIDHYPCIVPNWDNTPRSGARGVVLHDSTPDLFRIHLNNALTQMNNRPVEKKMVFIKSWNEWAEGNYLEPDIKYGKTYLKVIKEEILNFS
jgi:lipopolysaccharide biosynthesis protein